MVHIYFSKLNEDLHLKLLEKSLEHFSVDYQNKILRYQRWQDAQLSLLGWLLLKFGLMKRQISFKDAEVSTEKYGKPCLKNQEVAFNISHSGNIAVCAISTSKKQIGIDLELIRNINIEEFRNQMTLNEWKIIWKSENRYYSFFDYWTKKEAALKACGCGFSILPSSFEVRDNTAVIDDERYILKEISIDMDYKCHLAANTRIEDQHIHKFFITPQQLLS